MLGAPDNGVCVEVSCWVEPQIKLLFSVSFSSSEHVGVKDVGVTAKVPEELEVDLIMRGPLR